MKPKWKIHEDKLAKEFKGKKRPGSGSQWNKGGDILSSTYLIEAKQTDKKSYSINLKTWRKIYNEALFSYRLPLLSLKIQETELVILSKDDFLSLIKYTP